MQRWRREEERRESIVCSPTYNRKYSSKAGLRSSGFMLDVLTTEPSESSQYVSTVPSAPVDGRPSARMTLTSNIVACASAVSAVSIIL